MQFYMKELFLWMAWFVATVPYIRTGVLHTYWGCRYALGSTFVLGSRIRSGLTQTNWGTCVRTGEEKTYWGPRYLLDDSFSYWLWHWLCFFFGFASNFPAILVRRQEWGRYREWSTIPGFMLFLYRTGRNIIGCQICCWFHGCATRGGEFVRTRRVCLRKTSVLVLYMTIALQSFWPKFP